MRINISGGVFLKKFIVHLLMFFSIIMGFFIINETKIKASIIQQNYNTYMVTSGNDLFQLLDSISGYWNSRGGPPADLKINVNQAITLPFGLYNINSKIKNVEVDFEGHGFYVADQGGSIIRIPSSSTAKVKVSNLHIETNATSNYVTGIPNTAGTGTGSGYYTTYFGMLFSADFGPAILVKDCAAEITYNNVYYNVPNNLGFNQPLCSYYVPINFTGENYINTAVTGQQVGEIPNIKVSSGNTTIIGGNGQSSMLALGMFLPYFNQLDNKTFQIDVAAGSTLSIIDNDRSAAMFQFYGTNNAIAINNSGVLNMTSNMVNAPLFGGGTTGISLNAQIGATTNLKAMGPVFDGTKMVSSAGVNATLMPNSKTAIISTNAAAFNNSKSWPSSIIQIIVGAKLLTYGGGPGRGGITDAPNHDIPLSYLGSSLVQGYNRSNIPKIPKNTDDYDSLIPNDSKLLQNGSQVSSNSITNPFDSGVLISSTLTPVLIGDGNYNWNYDIDQLPDKDQFLTRTSGDKIRFQVNDTRDTKPKFRITAAYKPNQNQTYSMWFKHNASEDVSKATQLNSNEQTIMDGSQMHAQNGVYTSDFGNDAGLVIRANNRATAGKYSGVVDWTVVNGM